MVPYRGSIVDVVHQIIGGLRASMGYVGGKDIKHFQENAEFVEITSAGLKDDNLPTPKKLIDSILNNKKAVVSSSDGLRALKIATEVSAQFR